MDTGNGNGPDSDDPEQLVDRGTHMVAVGRRSLVDSGRHALDHAEQDAEDA